MTTFEDFQKLDIRVGGIVNEGYRLAVNSVSSLGIVGNLTVTTNAIRS